MTTAGDDRDYVPALGQHWLTPLDPIRADLARLLKTIGTYMLALMMTIAPVLSAHAGAGHDHTLSGHVLEVETRADDHHTDGHDHDHEASSEHDDGTHGAADTLCCEDVGLCSVGYVLPLNGGKTSSPHVASYGLPGDASPWHDHLGRPDGPPPRSHS